jgi:hypothetical protein
MDEYQVQQRSVEPGTITISRGRKTMYLDYARATADLEERPHYGCGERAENIFLWADREVRTCLGEENFREVLAAAKDGTPFSKTYQTSWGEFYVRTGWESRAS